jgi:endonuclease/exonuclease/phosphatase (EEP) superfamily protein YafD
MSATPARLRVLSMNLRNGGAGVSELARLIEVLAPDVVAVQELGPEQADLLGRRFSFGKLDAARDFTGMGLALRFPATVWRMPMSYRPAYVAEITLPGEPPGAEAVEIINVHFAAPHVPPPWRAHARRREQLRVLEAHLDASRRPRAVVGDLNATPLWPIYRRLRVHLTDAAVQAARQRGARPARTWGPRPGTPRLLRIDHALIEGLGILGVEVHPIPGSDHSALLLDITRIQGTP